MHEEEEASSINGSFEFMDSKQIEDLGKAKLDHSSAKKDWTSKIRKVHYLFSYICFYDFIFPFLSSVDAQKISS